MSEVDLIVLAVLCLAAYQVFSTVRRAVHRSRLPPPSVDPSQVATYQRQAFQEIARRSNGPGFRVGMREYFASRGWNRADATLILEEPLKHGMLKVKGVRFGSYGLSRRGWKEYRKNFMWMGRDEEVHISAGSGGFVVANVNSPRAVAQVGHGNSADQREISHHLLADALRRDAQSAEPGEAARAQEYADDLSEAVQAENTERADRIIGRINALLTTAQSAFTLTRNLLPPVT